MQVDIAGLTLAGPGSEWFWTAVSGLILGVTFIAIWRQLRLQRAAMGYSQVTEISRDDVGESMLRMKLQILEALRDGVDPAFIPYGPASYVIDFWEDVGALVRLGHMDKRLLYMTMGPACVRWWVIVEPFMQRVRLETGEAGGGENFEWLAKAMARIHRAHGGVAYDAETVRAGLEHYILNNRDRLMTAEALRAPVAKRHPVPMKAARDAAPVTEPRQTPATGP
jgi:hypothetical protein